MLHEVRHIGINEHSATGGQGFAVDTNNLAIIHSDIPRSLNAGPNLRHAFLDVAIELGGSQNTPPADDDPHETFKVTAGDN